MRVLVVADPHIPVPPVGYGGTERIAHLLCEGLASRGHAVNLIAGVGSHAYGGRLMTHTPPTAGRLSRAYHKLRFQPLVLRAARNADVVVTHGRPDYLWAVYRTRTPVVVQFQNPVDQEQIDAVSRHRRDRIRFVGISRDQVSGLVPADRIDVIYNAAATDRLPLRPKPAYPPYLAFLGRLTPNKGVHLAIDAARKAGLPLVLAGNRSDHEPGAEGYFETSIQPHLGPMVEWIGPVDDAGKAELLGGATALLFPIQWREPFGIVMAESLACGCPVIGWRSGSVPEVVTDGKTGFVVDSVKGMVAAIGRVGEIDRSACRRAAEERFSPNVLVDGYVNVFKKLTCSLDT